MKQFKILLTSMLLMGSTYAATFNVTTTAEFRQALLDAAQNGQNDTIVLADGTYKTTDDGGGTFSAWLYGDNMNLTITNTANGAILSGDNHSNTVLELGNLNELKIDNIAISDTLGLYKHGMSLSKILKLSISNSSFQNLTSCALYITSAQTLNDMDINITNTSFVNISGGLPAITATQDIIQSLQIGDSEFNNLKTGVLVTFTSGFNYDAPITFDTVTIINSDTTDELFDIKSGNFTLNKATITNNTYGSSFNVESGDISILNSKFENNTLTGSYAKEFFIYTPDNIKIINTSFSNLTGSGSSNFFMSIQNAESVIIDRSIFENISNTLSVMWFSKTNVLINNSIFKGNSTNSYLFGNAKTNIINSMFLNNKSSQYGDASFTTYSFGSNIINSFVLNNGVNLGSYQNATTVLYNSSVPIYNASINTPTFYNNIDIPTGSYAIANNVFSVDYIDILDDQNISLENNSYVYDKGISLDAQEIVDIIDNPVFSEYLAQNNQYDFLGNPRIDGSGIDVGPIEYISTPVPPMIPTNITATDGTLETVVGVTWGKVANTDYYNIYRSESQSETGDLIGITTSASFADDTIVENRRYYYSVQACNDVGCSNHSVSDGGYIGRIATDALPAIITYLLF